MAATRLLGDRAAAEVVVQEALVRAWRSPDSLVNGRASVRSRLRTVVRNPVIDRVRAGEARPAEAAEYLGIPPGTVKSRSCYGLRAGPLGPVARRAAGPGGIPSPQWRGPADREHRARGRLGGDERRRDRPPGGAAGTPGRGAGVVAEQAARAGANLYGSAIRPG
ncbi:hypothetical protein GCM10022222_35290 [Amycolatopsis ultiminotia]|uniref:RNA polymerase sigma-70 region 2 domain-containing protein n=1 Tax=Amycolatopsis ultiminotia TaxID=543629 RepID=A0ABP6WEJ5_9PSEU